MRIDEREVYLVIGASSDVALAYIRHIATKSRDSDFTGSRIAQY